MPFDSNGNFSLVPSYLATTGQPITVSQHNPPLEDIASGLSSTLLRSGVAPMNADLDMGAHKVIGLADGVANTDAATKGQTDTAIAAAITALGLGGSATKDVGTTAGTVAAGDDTRIVKAVQRDGDTMTGDLTLKGDPTTPLMAVPKQYADSRGAPDAVIEDQKAAGTPGGTFSTGAWRTRDINTKVRDPHSLVSVASNQFVPTVSGWVEWQTTVGVVQNNTTRLQNITDGTTAGYGMSSRKVDDATNVIVCGGAPVVAGKTYELQHQCAQSKTTDGFGIPGTFGTEVYTRINFWRS